MITLEKIADGHGAVKSNGLLIGSYRFTKGSRRKLVDVMTLYGGVLRSGVGIDQLANIEKCFEIEQEKISITLELTREQIALLMLAREIDNEYPSEQARKALLHYAETITEAIPSKFGIDTARMLASRDLLASINEGIVKIMKRTVDGLEDRSPADLWAAE